jgi:hypothetical protein
MKRTLIFFFFLALAATAQDSSRAQLYAALLDAKVLNPDRQLVHLSHTCNLQIDGAEYPVVDLQENVKSETSPHGVNRIIVLDAHLKPVQTIEYTTHRPLFCVENRLYVYGDLAIDNVVPEGNVLTFSNQGRIVKLSHVEAHAYPIPITRDRKSPPQ